MYSIPPSPSPSPPTSIKLKPMSWCPQPFSPVKTLSCTVYVYRDPIVLNYTVPTTLPPLHPKNYGFCAVGWGVQEYRRVFPLCPLFSQTIQRQIRPHGGSTVRASHQLGRAENYTSAILRQRRNFLPGLPPEASCRSKTL